MRQSVFRTLRELDPNTEWDTGAPGDKYPPGLPVTEMFGKRDYGVTVDEDCYYLDWPLRITPSIIATVVEVHSDGVGQRRPLRVQTFLRLWGWNGYRWAPICLHNCDGMQGVDAGMSVTFSDPGNEYGRRSAFATAYERAIEALLRSK